MWQDTRWLDSSVRPEEVWSLWSDLATWAQWNPSVGSAVLDSAEFAVGSVGTVTPVRGRGSRVRIVFADPRTGFDTEVRLPLARLRMTHRMSQRPDGILRVAQGVTVTGPLAALFGPLVGRRLVEGFPAALEGLVRMALAARTAGRETPA
jgi:Polyketide cyclase / dehydrase and lipid transport